LSKISRKGFAIAAIIVGAVGIGIGAYSIATVASTLDRSKTELNREWILAPPEDVLDLAFDKPASLGSISAPVTIFEFGDYQCPNCQRFATQVKPLIVKNYVDRGNVRLVFKDFVIYGSDSVNGALAAHCAGDQGRFWDMHDLMYSNQEAINSGWLSTDNIRRFASEIDLDAEQFDSCFNNKKYAEKITKNVNEGKTLGVDGTPTFIIIDSNGEMMTVRGAQPFGTFKEILDKALEG